MTIDKDRIAGSLYGLLVGDAFGCPVEGWTPRRIADVYGRLTDMEEATERWRPRGLHSDDGQQALALAAALLTDPKSPETVFGRILVEMYESGPRSHGCFGSHRGTGLNFRRTVKALAAGTEPHACGQPSAGNGVAMMIAPVAWLWHRDPNAMAGCVVRVARVKQTDIRGIASAGAVAAMTAQALRITSARDFDPPGIVAAVLAHEDLTSSQLGSASHVRTLSSALTAMTDCLRQPREAALRHIVETANRTADRPCSPGTGYAAASVITAIYMTLTSSSFEQAVVDTVALGGDTDTTGAMVGAMAGALYGLSAIPRRWLDRLVARGAFDDWVDAICERRVGWVPSPSLAELERGWTRLLQRGRGKHGVPRR